jgi:hypothetical protein
MNASQYQRHSKFKLHDALLVRQQFRQTLQISYENYVKHVMSFASKETQVYGPNLEVDISGKRPVYDFHFNLGQYSRGIRYPFCESRGHLIVDNEQRLTVEGSIHMSLLFAILEYFACFSVISLLLMNPFQLSALILMPLILGAFFYAFFREYRKLKHTIMLLS